MMRPDEMFIEHKCEVCGKEFCKPRSVEWGYKYRDYNGIHYYCSWHCTCEADRRREEKAQKLGKKWTRYAIGVPGLRLIRLSRDLGVKELAEMIGVRASTIHGYEDGSMNPGKDKVNKLAAVLGCTTEELRRE